MDFFLSPGFGGAGALVAAAIAFAAAQTSTRQRRRADEAALAEAALRREQERRVDAIQRCWDRYVWIVDHVDEIGVNLTIGLLSRITDAAAQLEDHDLVEFSREFALELFTATEEQLPDGQVSEEQISAGQISDGQISDGQISTQQGDSGHTGEEGTLSEEGEQR